MEGSKPRLQIVRRAVGFYAIIFLAIICLHGVECRKSNSNSNRQSTTQKEGFATDIKDILLDLQCYAKCEVGSSPKSTEVRDCRKKCKIEVMKLPRRGFCPNTPNAIAQNISLVKKLPCLDNCYNDFDCPAVQKCCDTICGPICMDAVGLKDDTMLPPIPKILKFKLPRGNKVELTIQYSGDSNSTYFCHVEVRYHIGLLFSPRKLGMWHWQAVEKIAEISDNKSKRTYITFNLKPGHWYQVRVAAVNAYGLRGYSEHSKAFTLTHHPKPPKAPSDLKVTSLGAGYCTVKIAWCPSKSNLPIEKYKIFWSLYVKSKEESLISSEAYVKNAQQFEITNLLPDSSYYIQVQAMSISGSRRLKSEKRSLLFNSTSPTVFEPLKCAQHEPKYSKYDSMLAKPKQHEVRYRLNRRFGMIVQISGFLPQKEKVFELCSQDKSCEQREYSAIRAKKFSLEFSRLKYNTNYILRALKTNSDEIKEPSFVFTTPKCENFRDRFPKMQIKC